MVTVTKKHQISFALIAVVFATAMIVASSGNMAFATHHRSVNIKSSSNSQSISQPCVQDQNNAVTTSGLISPAVLSGNNAGLCFNVNAGGNAANQDQSNSH